MAKYLDNSGLSTVWTKIKNTFALLSHSHGNITDDGKLTGNGNNVATNDKIVIANQSNSITKSTLAFNTNEHSKYLRQDGQWEVPDGTSTGTVTNIATGAGLKGGPITTTGTIKANLKSETSMGTIGTTDKLYAVGVDSNGNLATSVSWIDTDATTSAHGLMSTADKTKLNGIAAGAEVNQNAFSNITAGGTTVVADSKTDTVTFIGNGGITITGSANTDTITFAGTTYSGMDEEEAKIGTSTTNKLINASVLHSAIMNEVNKITGIEFRVVQTLPATGENGVIYLVRHSHGVDDTYDEYVWVSDNSTIYHIDSEVVTWASVPSSADFWPNKSEDIVFENINGELSITDEGERTATSKPSSVSVNGYGCYDDNNDYYYYEYYDATSVTRDRLAGGFYEKIGNTDIDLSHYWQNNDSTGANYLIALSETDINQILV